MQELETSADITVGEAGLLSEEAILKALEAIRARIARQEQQRAELDRQMEVVREEERLLERLLDVRRGAMAPQHRDTRLEGASVSQNPVANAKLPAIQAVVEELTAAGRPLHISDLMRLLNQRQVRIPGAGTQANLIIHLRRDERLVRPSRGMYGLASWGLENMSATRRRHKKRRIRVTANSGKD